MKIMKIEYVCQNCNKKYFSYKENSKYCSRECRKESSNTLSNCDCCNKQIMLSKRKVEQLNTGLQKNKFCSKKCYDTFQRTSVEKKCKNCGEKFLIYKCFEHIQEFCTRICYDDYRIKNSQTHISKICPICSNVFISKRKEQIYCSNDCKFVAAQNRITCTCEQCGKVFDRIASEYENSIHHYCSYDCRDKAMFWSKTDSDILNDLYGKMPYKDMIKYFSSPKTVEQISRRAIFLGLTSSRLWDETEINILKDNYSYIPMNEVLELLPARTYSSILGKARSLNLKSYYYLTSCYSDDENDFLIDNYQKKSNEELGVFLGRTEKAISLHLFSLGLKRPKEDSKYYNYLDLKRYVRSRIVPWRNELRENNGYKCEVTGKRSNIIVHHTRSFNLLFDEVVASLNFPLYESMSLYKQEELDIFVDTFLCLQEHYHAYVCISETVHKQFHKEYGYGNNTESQWDEFVNNYYSNAA